MKFLNKIGGDIAVIGAGALVIMTCSVLLYAEITRKVQASGSKQIGTITYKREVAQRKYTSQVIWEDLEQNTPVYNNDSIRTADMSEARINLKGTIINLDENSLILLSMTGEGVNINFSHGSISANQGGLEEIGPARINIQSGDSVVSIDKGDVKLSKTDEKGMDVTVTSGKADITTGAEKKTVEKDERAVITGDSETKVIKMPVKLREPVPNRVIVTAARAAAVAFSWDAVPEKAAMHLEIARDAKFARNIITRPAEKNTISEDLAEGGYYWRIKVVDAASGTTDYSDAWKLSVIKDVPVRLISPLNGEKISYSLKPPIINFRWQENSLASEYVLEISRDHLFKEIAQSVSTQLKDISLDSLTAGPYFWRVRTLNAGLPSYGGVSPHFQMHIEKRAAVAPPLLISPPDAAKASAAMFGPDKKYFFSWSASSQIREYDFTISSDRDFKNVIFSAKGAENFYSFSKPLPPGSYYWRVGALTEAPQEIFSAAHTLSVIAAEDITLNEPEVLDARDGGKDDKLADVRFSWKRINYQGTYRFEMSIEPGFLDINAGRTTRDNSVDIQSVRAGAYYWRVRLYDNERNQIAESVPRRMFVSYAGAIVARIEDIEVPRTVIKAAEDKGEQAQGEKGADNAADLAEKELAKKKEEELAGKQQEEQEKKQRDELARKQQEELARKQQLELAKNKQEELARIKREAAERKKREALSEKKREDAGAIKKAQDKKAYKEKFPGNRLRWRTALASGVMSQPVIHNNSIIMTTKNGLLVGLNQKGRQLWSANLGSVARSTPATDKTTVYVATVKGLLYAINAATGAVRWSRSIEGPLLFGAAPIVENGRVFVATSYGVVQAFSAEGGDIWKKNLEEGIFGPICYEKGVLFVGTDRSKIYAIDADKGDIKWTYKTDGRIFASSPKVHAGVLFVGCYSGTFYALEPSKGDLLWKFTAKKPIVSSPVFFNDIVYFGSEDGIFYALKINSGNKVWEFVTGGNIVAGPNVSQKNVLIPSGSVIYSVDANSGELNWKQDFTAKINTPVTIEGGDAFLGLDNGEVVSLRSF